VDYRGLKQSIARKSVILWLLFICFVEIKQFNLYAKKRFGGNCDFPSEKGNQGSIQMAEVART
jgi:hypothetical protein